MVITMKKIQFTKMHGSGNDYIFIDCSKNNIENPQELAKIMSKRHFSVGSDGIVLILPSPIADAEMKMYNKDGSEGKMCGNAIRCVGKYIHDNWNNKKEVLNILTASGIKKLSLSLQEESVTSVSVDMGRASFKPSDIPLSVDTQLIDYPITALGKTYLITALSVGNPHTVIYTDSPDYIDIDTLGNYFSCHRLFPDRCNVEFVKIISRNKLAVRVFERGCGETLSCGSGACAAALSSVLFETCDFNTPIEVKTRGGVLTVSVNEHFEAILSADAVTVFEGVFFYDANKTQ